MANIGGLKFIGMQSQSANPLAEIIAQIQQGTMGGYQSGQAFGLDFLRMQPEAQVPKPPSESVALQRAKFEYQKKEAQVPKPPSESVALQRAKFEYDKLIKRQKELHDNITGGQKGVTISSAMKQYTEGRKDQSGKIIKEPLTAQQLIPFENAYREYIKTTKKIKDLTEKNPIIYSNVKQLNQQSDYVIVKAENDESGQPIGSQHKLPREQLKQALQQGFSFVSDYTE